MKKFQLLAFSVLTAMAANAQIVINEYCANSTSFLDEYGDSNDWIELLNTSSADVNLDGWHLSDKADNLTKWTFPAVTIKAGEYLKIFASSKDLKEVAAGKFLHTNFNISSDGEAFFLSDASGKIIHQTDSIAVPNDVSRGLSPDGNGSWVFFAEPTPGAANTTKTFATAQTPQVRISPEGGVKTSAVTITLETDGSSPIYYTLDCTVPTKNSQKYTGPITVDTTTVIRAITFNDDMLPAQPATQSYIFGNKLKWTNRNEEWISDNNNNNGGGWGGWGGFGGWGDSGHYGPVTETGCTEIGHDTKFTLPVFSLTVEPNDLWDYNTGIYVKGENAERNEPFYNANFHQDWERPIHVELYWTDGQQIINQDAGVQIAGAYSRKNEQKSFAIHARSAYGKKYFEAKLFDELDITRFKSFTLRDSGNDFAETHFRDAMITHLVANNNIDIQAYQPAIIFLNGEFWGILNIREKLNEHYIENHYPHVDHDKVDIMAVNTSTNSMMASEGDDIDYNALINYVKSNDMTDNACYQYIASLIDIDEYIEYMVSEIYAANSDWPHNNVKTWKSKKNGGRWRWCLYDMDQSYSIWNRDQSGDDRLGACLDNNDFGGRAWANVLFINLTKNEDFRNSLANRFADRMNNEFLPENVNHLIDSLYNNISEEIKFHNSRWNIQGYDDKPGQMKDFAQKRPNNMRNHLRNHFKVGADVKVTLYTNDDKAGYVQLNSLTLKKFPWSGTYFKDVPISIRAIARPGYKFSHWEDANGNNVDEHAAINVKLDAASEYTAVFESSDLNYSSVVINEINFKSADDFDTKDWIELYNTTSAAINISNWKISNNDTDGTFTMPKGTMLPPYGYLVVSSNQNKLYKLEPNLKNVVGDFSFGLGKSEKLQLFDSEGNLIDEVEYNSKSWSDADGNGYTLSLTDPFSDNSNRNKWNANDMHGTPGRENGNFNPSHTDFSIADNTFSVGVDDAPVANVQAMCYPNPFRTNAAIVWEQATDADVVIELYAASGLKLATTADGAFESGLHKIDISHIVGDWASGLYFAKITVDGQKPIILKIMKQ
ncbi:MAG: CotH kinase family protein [Salinivirgaceae bacterium]|nr:CotH kinase family protein [Salinivirgaceae bacterium]